MNYKEGFKKIKAEMPYIRKDNERYILTFYEPETNTCVYRKHPRTDGKKPNDCKEYKNACKLYNIVLEDETPTPIQHFRYFLRNIDKKKLEQTLRTLADEIILDYIRNNKEDCLDVLEALKNIVKTNPERKVREAAYNTCSILEADGYKEFEKYIDSPEITKIKKTLEQSQEKNQKQQINPKTIATIDMEKGILVYITLAIKYKDSPSNINTDHFHNRWRQMFKSDAVGSMGKRITNVFKYLHNELVEKTIDEIINFRQSVRINTISEIPLELKRLSARKGFTIALAKDLSKKLSGFDLFRNDTKFNVQRINKDPFDLTEAGAYDLLNSLPDRNELLEKEQNLTAVLNSESLTYAEKREIVNSYTAPYATHDFKKSMNRYTIHTCDQKELTKACVNLCKRVGIENLSNFKPIEYNFCNGSGHRKTTMKNVRKSIKSKKKNKKKGK